VFLVLHSLLFSRVWDVSVLKAVSWTVAAATSLSAWSSLPLEERNRLTRRIFGGLTAILIASLPLVLLPVGYFLNGHYFQGLLNQPQAFGLAMAMLGVWAVSETLAQARPRWAAVVLAGGCFTAVILSEARTAGVAMVAGVFLAALTVSSMGGHRVRAAIPGLTSPRVHLVVGVLLIAGLVGLPVLVQGAGTFIVKRGTGQGIVAAYAESRGFLLERMLANVEASPLTGIGFGVASDPYSMIVQRDDVLGLPTAAVVEKGATPVAILEEVGVFGFLLLAAWVWAVLRAAAQNGLTPFTLVVTILLMNLGEATLFSPGGMGLLSLILLGWAVNGARRAEPQ
jgi:hypothetical protein